MKIKLNVSKDLKRQLKEKVADKELERNDFIYQVINHYIDEHKALWVSEIDEIMEAKKHQVAATNFELENNEEGKAEFVEQAKSVDKLIKTSKKLQTIMLHVDEKTYFTLELMGKKMNQPMEELIINQLKRNK